MLAALFLVTQVFLTDTLPGHAETVAETDEYGVPVRNSSDSLPSWYPADKNSFVPFHDADIPRVVDKAEILTDEQEAAIKESIETYSKEAGKDIVVVTDKSDYSLGHELYCYDFYDYNGYGIGDGYEGICLYICMDPANRGWWAGVTGDISKSLYTEENANRLDDALYEYMSSGEYGDGILDWVKNIYTLYTKGIPFAPDWYPATIERESYIRTYNADAPRVFISSDVKSSISPAEEQELTNRAKEISDKYNVDVVIHISKSDYGRGQEKYAGEFCYYNGYGFGDDHNLITLCIFKDSDDVYIETSGKIKDELSIVNYTRMLEQSQDADDDLKAAEIFLDNLLHWEKTGRVTRTAGQWVFAAIVSVLVGFFFGKKALKKAGKNMVTVHSAYGADNYVSAVSDFNNGTDTMIDRSIQKTKIPRYTSSSSYSSGSSRSRSTYHSSSRGSSGRSHSGSGRRF